MVVKMKLDDIFIKKFNELDQLSKKLYPKYSNKKFDALRHFAYSLSQSDKSSLLNLITARNTYAHDERNLIHFDQQSINFIQGLIDGANRKLHYGKKHPIDSDTENLRTNNLRIMSKKLNQLQNKMYSLSDKEINRYKSYLNSNEALYPEIPGFYI
jgi:hypothetical protein